MIEKEFIPYEEALELKELGFDESCLGWFKNRKFTASFNDLYMNPHERGKELEIIKAPIFSQAFRWFREKYNKLSVTDHATGGWYFVIREIGGSTDPMLKAMCGSGFKSYEEAELACLRKLIEIVQGDNK